MSDGTADLAIVGAGILGLATARTLLQRDPRLRIVILEREDHVGRHQTGSNSGVIHAGIYYAPGSLKARLCGDGRRRMYEFCEEHGIAHARCGKVIAALTPDEVARLDELERRGHANGVPGLRRIGSEELAEIEPHAAGIAALHSPDTGIVDFAEVARVLARLIEQAGSSVWTSAPVRSVHRGTGGGVSVRHARGELRARRAIVCAGAWTDRLATAAGAPADPRIVPFRGAYLRLKPAARPLVRGLIYPVPDPRLPFLGVHLTRRIDGEVLLGPSALMVGAPDAYRLARVDRASAWRTLTWPGSRRLVRRFWRTGMDELRLAASRRAFVAACARYVPELRAQDVTDGPAGVRAQAVGRDGSLVDDFVFSDTPGALFVRNAPSPGATSALAIADHIADRVRAALH